MGKAGEKKKSQLKLPSPESSSNNSSSIKGSFQGDSDWESTSVTSSMQSSTSSATSTLCDQDGSSVKGETRQKTSLNKSNSKKLMSFSSFMSSRRRAQSRLSRSSIKLSDDGSTTPQHPSSIEVSDESSSVSQKPMPKFSRTGSLRSVKIFMNKNKPSFKSKKSSSNKNSEVSEESHLKRATFSSILKDSKFPEQLKHQAGPLDPEEVLPVAKFCPYHHCSLHGHHHHHHETPPKRFAYLKRRTTKDQKNVKPESQSKDKGCREKSKVKVTKKVSNGGSGHRDEAKIGDRKDDVDFSIEFYAKTRSEPLIGASQCHDDADDADILFGVNSFQAKSNERPTLNHQSSIDSKNENDSVLGKKSALKETNHVSMWHMIHRHMVSGLTAESGDKLLPQADEEKKSDTEDVGTSPQMKDSDDAASQEAEIRKMFAIKLVREAIEKILLPEVQDDQSTTSDVISEQDLSEKSRSADETTSEPKELPQEAMDVGKEGKRTPKRWSYLKKVILLTKFVKELEKVKKFSPKKPRHLPMVPELEAETVSLRHWTTIDKKNADEWMLDYALRKVVSDLAPTQKRKVALLVKAFETVVPAQEDQQESRANVELRRDGSDTKVQFKETSESTVDSMADSERYSKAAHKVVSSSFAEPPEQLAAARKEKEKEPNFDLSAEVAKEKHIKMWHMIYQHVVTDIASKVGSELLLDGEESADGEEKNFREVEDHIERNYRLGFTRSDAVKLVRESVDEILLPDVPDGSSQDTRSVASDVASDREELLEGKEVEKAFVVDESKKPTMEAAMAALGSRFRQQKSENWSKLKKLILLKRSLKVLESFRKLKPQNPQQEVSTSEPEAERADLRRQMVDERKKAEQWMLDYAVQHIVTKLTPARKKRVSMLVEAFEAVVPLPES